MAKASKKNLAPIESTDDETATAPPSDANAHLESITSELTESGRNEAALASKPGYSFEWSDEFGGQYRCTRRTRRERDGLESNAAWIATNGRHSAVAASPSEAIEQL